jgi:tetratricopeptide (TPR) repeat protein
MESQKINILLQKYFDAETNLQEENELINYFNSGNVDETLTAYIPMFEGLKDISTGENTELGDDLMNYILESEHKEKLHYRWMWQIVTGVAASVILVMLAVNFYGNQNHWDDTYKDPDKAYAEATKTLEFVAGKYNQGLAQLKPIGKIEQAVSPYNSGINMLNKGFGKVKNLEIVNQKLKKE